ncbi:dimethylsulfonioproprionate lyase family protein [Roseibium polysiphoniae]|uniref:Dimethylsulfoniopropionate lyase n=1 Tax=Roseibium polysiphoniae TaxID=2571221 RepID=A0ABR9C7E4_9HYPH|nr:dimethylsulfonioproprionate lyase family protein [Roseibium polysiphoniae]MBD8874836.1 dimethylsulfoniopropionate lyase [Roseibium polysiphoniae]
MQNRSAALQAFVDAAETAFKERAQGEESRRSVSRSFSALAAPADKPRATPANEGSRLPVCDAHLDQMIDPTRFPDADLAALAETFRALEPALSWSKRKGTTAAASDTFDQGHANTLIIGPGGLERRTDVWLGVSLLAPDVRYPDHDHPPEETYLCMSRGEFTHGGSDWFEPGPGGSFYNSPGILHAMRSGSEPLLAFWLLLTA